jgi:hydroxymethylpyrimidine pyrophosphatase-like HAD family hydrolase
MAMLELAGIGVAVANAWGGLKDHADYITASNDDDGVALAIEKFVLKR